MNKFNKNIIIIGFMGTGKTTVSNQLGKRLEHTVIDTDEQIVKAVGKSVAEIFKTDGEEFFRQCERRLLSSLLPETSLVLSCGGGMAMDEENVRLMKKLGSVFLLTAATETIFDRVKSSTKRPILNGHMDKDYIAKLYVKRKEKYLRAADFVVETDTSVSGNARKSSKKIEVICEEIENLCENSDIAF